MRKSEKHTGSLMVTFTNGAVIVAKNTTEAFASFRRIHGATPAIMASVKAFTPECL